MSIYAPNAAFRGPITDTSPSSPWLENYSISLSSVVLLGCILAIGYYSLKTCSKINQASEDLYSSSVPSSFRQRKVRIPNLLICLTLCNLCLSLSLLGYESSLLSSSSPSEDNGDSLEHRHKVCQRVGYLSEYFTLTSVLWMVAITRILFRKISSMFEDWELFGRDDTVQMTELLRLAVVCMVPPIIVVALMASFGSVGNISYTSDSVTNCWQRLHSGDYEVDLLQSLLSVLLLCPLLGALGYIAFTLFLSSEFIKHSIRTGESGTTLIRYMKCISVFFMAVFLQFLSRVLFLYASNSPYYGKYNRAFPFYVSVATFLIASALAGPISCAVYYGESVGCLLRYACWICLRLRCLICIDIDPEYYGSELNEGVASERDSESGRGRRRKSRRKSAQRLWQSREASMSSGSSHSLDSVSLASSNGSDVGLIGISRFSHGDGIGNGSGSSYRIISRSSSDANDTTQGQELEMVEIDFRSPEPDPDQDLGMDHLESLDSNTSPSSLMTRDYSTLTNSPSFEDDDREDCSDNDVEHPDAGRNSRRSGFGPGPNKDFMVLHGDSFDDDEYDLGDPSHKNKATSANISDRQRQGATLNPLNSFH